MKNKEKSRLKAKSEEKGLKDCVSNSETNQEYKCRKQEM